MAGSILFYTQIMENSSHRAIMRFETAEFDTEKGQIDAEQDWSKVQLLNILATLVSQEKMLY